MGDPHMDHARQIQAANEPARHEIGRADQQARPGTDRGWGEVHASQRIGDDERIASDVVSPHEEPPLDR
jgi:hypothetical protein